MIFGFPGEGEAERRESIALIMDVCRRYPGAEFWTNIFTPYPGAPDHAARLRTGHRRSENAGRLGRFLSALHGAAVAEGPQAREVQTMREYLRVAFNRVPIGVQRKNTLQRVVHGMIGVPARWRLDHDFYSLSVRAVAEGLREPPGRSRRSRRWMRNNWRPRSVTC